MRPALVLVSVLVLGACSSGRSDSCGRNGACSGPAAPIVAPTPAAPPPLAASAPAWAPAPAPAPVAPPASTMACGAGKCGSGGSYEPAPSTETYAPRKEVGFVATLSEPVSTFSIDVDTASYSNVRRFLKDGTLPPADAVRVEEMLNYFPYAYPAPAGTTPFAADMEVADCPWAPAHRLVRIGVQGREVPRSDRPAMNLVFLLDVSGSMQTAKKLPLVKSSMELLLEGLDARDRVAIVVYAGAAGLVLPPTSGALAPTIKDALSKLEAGGSTAGAQGIELAYETASKGFVQGGANRVILCTDGDFNVGISDRSALVSLIEAKAKSGVFLTCLGFGMGNLKDATLESLADKGNGVYAYVDSEAEARKLFVDQLGATLLTIAKDVKLQVEFDPTAVERWRLLGYENRVLATKDFDDDAKDAGEIGAGHSVTAIYEIVPPFAAGPVHEEAPLKYQGPRVATSASGRGEILTLKIRHKAPEGDQSTLDTLVLTDPGRRAFTAASDDFRFAASVAAFGMLLAGSPDRGTASFADVRGWADAAKGSDPGGYRSEFVGLVDVASGLKPAK